MPYKQLTCVLLALLSLQRASAQGSFDRTADGVIIHPGKAPAGAAATVKLSVVADNIIRVLAGPAGAALRDTGSLITVYQRDAPVRWELKEDGARVILRTRLLTATVVIATGTVSFTDSAG